MEKDVNNTSHVIPKKLIEKQRKLWAKVAQKYKWYNEPFYIQLWINKYGCICESISFAGIKNDIFVDATSNKLINITIQP